MMYNRIVTAVLEVRATLADVDEETREALKAAADTYRRAPDLLKAQILAAAAKGEKPAAIARAIDYAYTYDYVATLVRNWRREQRLQRKQSAAAQNGS